jgi:HEPN domain-containing protein
MKPPEDEVRRLVTQWVAKAELDFKALARLGSDPELRDVAAFHAQQAAEKYLKAVLTRHQVEFPKTHVLRRLLILLAEVEPVMAGALDEANWLSPFGSELRYPGDRAETLPGDEIRAFQLAEKVRTTVMASLEPYLADA